MGLGLIVGQNQRVDQGTINAILKILSFGVNPIYLRNRDDNAPTQTIRTNLGKIMSVTDVEKSYKLLEQPKVPSDIWSAIKESEAATESSSGADQTLVQGSSAGPRAGMGRSATGANLMAGASATRLDGPLDNFIEQVFKPFLTIIDMLVFNVMSDASILHILGRRWVKTSSRMRQPVQGSGLSQRSDYVRSTRGLIPRGEADDGTIHGHAHANP